MARLRRRDQPRARPSTVRPSTGVARYGLAQLEQTRCRPAELPAPRLLASQFAGPHRARAQPRTARLARLARLARYLADPLGGGRQAVGLRQSGRALAQASQSRPAWETPRPGPRRWSPRHPAPERRSSRSGPGRRHPAQRQPQRGQRQPQGPAAAGPAAAAAAPAASAVPAWPRSAAGSQGLTPSHGAGAAVASCRSVILPGLPPQPNYCSSSVCPACSFARDSSEPRTTPAGRHRADQKPDSERAVRPSGALGRADHTSPPRLSNLRPRLSSPRGQYRP